MFDFFGNLNPDGLVALDMPITDFTDDESAAIIRLKWYGEERRDRKGPMYVSQAALRAALGRDLPGLRGTTAKVVYVAAPLHRYSFADGFYNNLAK